MSSLIFVEMTSDLDSLLFQSIVFTSRELELST